MVPIRCHVYQSVEAARSRKGGRVELISFPHSSQILPPEGLTISGHVTLVEVAAQAAEEESVTKLNGPENTRRIRVSI
jgi:hypothetical protein